MNVTVPLGATERGKLMPVMVTLAVKVTDWLTDEVLLTEEEASVVLVAAAETAWVNVLVVLA